MSDGQKLTKKQKKGLAFRQKKGKSKPDTQDIPDVENQDLIELQVVDAQDQVESPTIRKPALHPGEAKHKKRKREDEAETASLKVEGPPKKKVSKKETEPVDEKSSGQGNDKSDTKSQTVKAVKSRFILFVGNLKYTTSKDALSSHFAACDPPPTIRLLSPKTGSTTKSKGCAFLEFSHRNALQQALKLHQSELEGRRINVELTAGGGGKSEQRLQKVKERNRALGDQRKKRVEKQSSGESTAETLAGRPQRHSTTSGIEQEPLKSRTWTVSDADDGKTHRGGVKHAKKGKNDKGRRPKDWSTGVNSIPVG